MDCCFGPSHVLEITESRLSSATLIRDIGGAGDEPGEGLVVFVFLSDVTVGTQSVFPGGSVGNCRRSDVLPVDLVMTVPEADIEVEGRLEPLMSLMEVLSFLDLSLLRILFLPMM